METNRLAPQPDWESAHYWEAAREGRLLVRRCSACGRAHWYPRPHCPYCQNNDPAWEQVSGGGTIYTFTVVRQNGGRAFRDLVPYAIGMVDLDEGARWFGFLRGDIDSLEVGGRVVVGFEDIGDQSLPYFVTSA
jgi:uncharacterized OB-fold protein